jgi:hypothetical protein
MFLCWSQTAPIQQKQLRSGDTVPVKDVAHRLVENLMAQTGKRSRNAVVSPAGLLPAHANDKLHHVLAKWWAARVAAML